MPTIWGQRDGYIIRPYKAYAEALEGFPEGVRLRVVIDKDRNGKFSSLFHLMLGKVATAVNRGPAKTSVDDLKKWVKIKKGWYDVRELAQPLPDGTTHAIDYKSTSFKDMGEDEFHQFAQDTCDLIEPISDGTFEQVVGSIIGKNDTEASQVPSAKYGGILAIADVQIPCYVLENGTRVIHQRGMVNALGMSRGGSSRGGGDRLAYFVAQKTLSPFVSKELGEVTKEPLIFRTDKGAMAYGYDVPRWQLANGRNR